MEREREPYGEPDEYAPEIMAEALAHAQGWRPGDPHALSAEACARECLRHAIRALEAAPGASGAKRARMLERLHALEGDLADTAH
ncbi:MAG: hypothetical protein AAF074_22885 [Pseudomonadota bacterium]